jgi:hypothetical protein
MSAPSNTAGVVDQVAFDLLAEAGSLAIDYAGRLEGAFLSGDRARSRRFVCQLSRITRTALLTVGDNCTEHESERA